MKALLTFFACFLLWVLPVNATKYYIDPLGSNSNSGLSSSTPFKTIDKGISTAASYDTVIVLSGTYPVSAPLTITKPITLLGTDAAIDGGAWSSAIPNKKLLLISNTSDVLVDGLVFKNLIGDYSIGIAIMGSGKNITIQHCLITNIGWIGSNLSAIPTGSNNANGILIDGTLASPLSQINVLYDTITNCALGFSEALTVVANVDTFTLDNNFIYANSNIGIDIAGSKSFASNPPLSVNYARNGQITHNTVFRCMSPIAISAGIYLDGAYNCIVDANTVYDNAVGISLGQESPVSVGAKSCSHNKITNNLIYRNAVAGVVWGDSFHSSPKVLNNTFANNTLFKNRTGAIINGVTSIGGIPAGTGSGQYGNIFGGEILVHSCDSSFFQNNILYPLGERRCVVVPDSYIATNLLFDYNNFYKEIFGAIFDIGAGASANGIPGLKTYPVINVIGLYQNTVGTNPLFVDTAKANFRLLYAPLSPCINAGNPSSTSSTVSLYDFDAKPRIYDGKIDIGAFETQKGLSIINSSPSSQNTFNVVLYPNPTTNLLNIDATQSLKKMIITDLSGRIVEKSQSPQKQIDINHLPNGIYKLQFISTTDEVCTKEILKL
jgi:parallel beta-helix repeat protein